jgi:hypothetical protein
MPLDTLTAILLSTILATLLVGGTMLWWVAFGGRTR